MFRRLAPAVVAVALAAQPVFAQAPLQANVVTSSTFTAIGGAGAGGYIGSATISSSLLAGSGPFAIFCVDQNNLITLGSTLTNAWITPLFNNTDMTRTRLGGDSNGSLAGVQPITADAFAIYRASASLAAQLQAANTATRESLQSRIWTNAEAPYNHALQGNSSFSALGWYVITVPAAVGNDNMGVQEMLAFRPVPEPSTYALLATGLGVIGMAAQRRRRLA